MKRVLFTLALCLSLSIAAPAQSHLQTVVDSMAPGDWAVLSQQGDGSNYNKANFHATCGSSGDFSFTSQAAHDPINGKILIAAGEHDGEEHLIKYDIATNAWTFDEVIPTPLIHSGTAQAGCMGTCRAITLDAGASATDNIYQEKSIRIVSGTGAGQRLKITQDPLSAEPTIAYNGTTKVAHVCADWTVNPDNTSVFEIYANLGHAYDSNAVADGKLYVDFTVLSSFRIYDIATNTWNFAPATSPKYAEASMAYFPDRRELLYLSGGWNAGLYKYNGTFGSGVDSFTALYPGSGHFDGSATTTINALQLRGDIVRYIPNCHCALLMGGVDTDSSPNVRGNAVYKYDSDGNLTRLGNLPSSIMFFPRVSIAWVDPASSDLLVINAVLSDTSDPNSFSGSFEFWKYTWINDTWTQLDFNSIPAPSTWWNELDGIVDALEPVSLPEYGVSAILSHTVGNGGGTTKVLLYKHATQAPSFTDKCAASGVLGCYGFNSSSNVRDLAAYPAAYPIKYGGWHGTTGSTDSGGAVCDAAGLGHEYIITQARVNGTPAGADELNAAVFEQNNTCYYPVIDTTTKYSGAGSLRIELPSLASAGNGGYFDTPFAGLDQTQVRIGPDNGAQIWEQYRYRTHQVVGNSFNGAFPDSFIKTQIFGAVSKGSDFFGSDNTLASTFNFSSGFSGNRNSLYESYTRATDFSLQNSERTINGEIWLQTANHCIYASGGNVGSPYPPCKGQTNDEWHEITRHFQLVPVASNFVVSTTHLQRSSTFDSGMVGNEVYIVGSGFFHITAYNNAGDVTLNASPSAGSGKSVYISNYPNSVLQEWVDGYMIMNNRDAIMAWDWDDAGWGEVRLLDQMTNKDGTIAHTPGTVWYDDLVISANPIAFGTNITGAGGSTPSSTTGGNRTRFRR